MHFVVIFKFVVCPLFLSIPFWFIGENAIRYLVCVCDLVVEKCFYSMQKCKYFIIKNKDLKDSQDTVQEAEAYICLNSFLVLHFETKIN